MEVQSQSSYNAPLKTKVAVITGTALSSGLCVAHMMKTKRLTKLSQLEMGIVDGIYLCTASTIGGLAGGLASDNKNTYKYKLKDSVNQLIGNTFVPFGFLAVANMFTKKLPKLAQSIIAIGTLIGTTFLGHNIANKVNKKVFKEDSNYTCNLKDFATDFDDVFFASSTVANSKTLYKITASMCPITYMAHGYLAGCRQEDKPTLDKWG